MHQVSVPGPGHPAYTLISALRSHHSLACTLLVSRNVIRYPTLFRRAPTVFPSFPPFFFFPFPPPLFFFFVIFYYRFRDSRRCRQFPTLPGRIFLPNAFRLFLPCHDKVTCSRIFQTNDMYRKQPSLRASTQSLESGHTKGPPSA